MTAIGDILGEQADKIVRDSISVGDVHLLPLNQKKALHLKTVKVIGISFS